MAVVFILLASWQIICIFPFIYPFSGIILSKFGESILKTRRFGYDGKGQITIKNEIKFDSNLEKLKNNAIIEKKIPFEFEFSQVACRDVFGNVSHFPLVRNVHENHILKHSYAPLIFDSKLENDIKKITKKIF